MNSEKNYKEGFKPKYNFKDCINDLCQNLKKVINHQIKTGI